MVAYRYPCWLLLLLLLQLLLLWPSYLKIGETKELTTAALSRGYHNSLLVWLGYFAFCGGYSAALALVSHASRLNFSVLFPTKERLSHAKPRQVRKPRSLPARTNVSGSLLRLWMEQRTSAPLLLLVVKALARVVGVTTERS